MAGAPKLGRDVKLRVAVERFDVVDAGGGAPLDALKARISLTQSGQHVEWTLRVHFQERDNWTLRKRFNEFATLHELLKKRVAALPELPPKSAVRQFSPEYLEARKAALGSYLQALCSRRDALNCPEAQAFFGLPERVAEFKQPCDNEPVQVAEVRESSFGVADFAFDAERGVLLVGATDASWTSRIDTKITNIKLPWEPAAPSLPTSQMTLWKQALPSLRFDLHFTSRYTATISCVALCQLGNKDLCLCGLSDGTVGFHPLDGDRGIRSAGSTLPLLRHTGPVSALAVDGVENWVISASKDKGVMVYDARRQLIQCEVQTPAPTSRMHYCQQQKRLFTGLANGRVVVWDASILPIQQVATIPDAADAVSGSKVSSMDFDLSTGTLFTAMKDGLTLWAVKSSHVGAWGRRMGSIPGVAGEARGLAWMPGSRELVAGLPSGAVVVFDVEAGEASYAFQAHREEVTSIVWLEESRRLITASKDKTIKIWDFPPAGGAQPSSRPPDGQFDISSAPGAAAAGASRAQPGGSSFSTSSLFANSRSGSGDPLGASGDVRPAQGTVAGRAPPAAPRGYPAAPASGVPAAASKAAAPSALAGNDSDDDLAGWDS